MKNLYGLTNIMVKVIDCKGDDVGELNKFLDEYNGNVVEIQTVGMLYGITRYVVIYKAMED